MRSQILIIAFIILTSNVSGQETLPLSHDVCTQQLIPLTAVEELQLKRIPELKLPPHLRGRSLPPEVDNSQQPYFRPVFNQDEYCCGQAAGIAYNFTYEIDRVRNLPANVPENQYPTHFAWNWLNSGYGWYGVSYLHSFEILKHYGMPNVVDYGGTLSFGGNDRWLSGYDHYYNGMHNRINNFYQMQVGTPEGLDAFKQWLFDHHEGSAVGGIGNFYAQYMGASTQLPAGTPEAGKYVLTYFSGSPNHAMTIVGYNDSIRYDYNGDGQYTNDIDINNDGIVDMKDWEIGGFKMAQSYGGVPNWGDQGFAYMMYKTVADDLGDGGIWNHCVHVLDVKEDCQPRLTMKVVLEHDRRNTIKVTAGVSDNLNAVEPDHVLGFPIFDYQGGALYMQGGTGNPANKTIEFGLDITPLLTEIEPGQDAKFFLQVDEDDPGNAGTGSIISYALMDYTSTVQEIGCPQTNVPLNENDITRLSINTVINFDKVEVSNASLPPGQVGSYYSQQMIASNGAPPYRWYLQRQYGETASASTFPSITQNQLTPSNNTSGFVTQPIDFEFPFYDSTYQEITVHVDGYLMFDEQLYPYPYFNDDKVLFTITRNISPFMTQELRIYPGMGDGIWYEGDENSAIFRIRAHLDDQTGYDVDMAVKLYPSGDIEYYYNGINVPDDLLWLSGISDGDDETFQHINAFNNSLPSPGEKVLLEPYNYPPELTLTEDGLLYGNIQNTYNVDLTFRVTDNNFISNFKTLAFATTGILINDSISSGGDDVIEYGETALLSVELINIEQDPVSNATMSISCNDSLINLVDSIEVLGTLPPGTPVNFEDAFSFEADPGIPNGYPIEIQTTINGNRQTWNSNLYYTGYAPELIMDEVIVMDSANGYLDPGEQTYLAIHISNTGGSDAYNLSGTLSCMDPFITIIDSTDSISQLAADSSDQFDFYINVAEEAIVGDSIQFHLDVTADLGLIFQESFILEIGRTFENFETGDFSSFSWGFAGDKDWKTSQISPYQGNFSARSGHISHSQESSLLIDINVLNDGEVSFFRKVSCEDDGTNDNYDFLAFFIDGEEMGRWDGETDWAKVSYSIDAGYHRLEWKYQKDNDLSSGMDGAWIDNIYFPSCSDAAPALSYEPDSFYMALKPGQQDQATLEMENAGMGSIDYDIWISSIPGKEMMAGNRSILGSYLECDLEVMHAGEQHVIELTVYNPSDDSEWIRDINLSFPEHTELLSATDFVGGSLGDLVWDGITGNGVTTNWHGEDPSGWGVIKPGETAVAEIVVFLETGATDDVSVYYEVAGDIYGSDPHMISGNLEMVNLGPVISWIDLHSPEGTMLSNSILFNTIYFDATGLDDGEYHCELIVNEQFQVVETIPVTFLVDQSLGTNGSFDIPSGLKAYPNPFRKQLSIEYFQEVFGNTYIEIYNQQGEKVYHHRETGHPGQKLFIWNGKDEKGFDCTPGIYLIKLVDPNKNVYTSKAMYIH